LLPACRQAGSATLIPMNLDRGQKFSAQGGSALGGESGQVHKGIK